LTAIKVFSNAEGWGVGEKRHHNLQTRWKLAAGQPGTEEITSNHLRGIDVLPSQATVTDWRENY
jgi:hypothetical protein